MSSAGNFGCSRCWPPGPEAAWQARGALRRAAELVDESHLHVLILACPACSQSFLSVFTEIVDWADSDDSQFWSLLPLTPPEAAALQASAPPPWQSFGSGRRTLHRDCPKGAHPSVYWSEAPGPAG